MTREISGFSRAWQNISVIITRPLMCELHHGFLEKEGDFIRLFEILPIKIVRTGMPSAKSELQTFWPARENQGLTFNKIVMLLFTHKFLIDWRVVDRPDRREWITSQSNTGFSLG